MTERGFVIAGRHVGGGEPVYVIAELSANHRQEFEEAVRLVHAAKEAGADAIKLQTYTPETITIDCDDERFRIRGGTPLGRQRRCTTCTGRRSHPGSGSRA